MRIEVLCSQCGNSYLADENAIEAGLVCPGCSAPVQVQTATARPRAELPPPSVAAAPPAAAPPGTATVAAVAPASHQAPAEEAQVVCPRCKLHFVPRRSAAAAEENRRRTVLVVEDMDYFREIAVDALAPRYVVKTAATVIEAQAALTEGGVDLMILDLTLDGGEYGVELLRTMAYKPCPILIYTAKDESEMYGQPWDELRALGADDLVMKGMNVGESLLRKAADLLGDELDEED
jgi:CheY-like chemotaxis protein